MHLAARGAGRVPHASFCEGRDSTCADRLGFFADPTTLQASLKPLPGELQIPANSPEATVEITQLEDVKKQPRAWVEP